jgi:hypothetical protein
MISRGGSGQSGWVVSGRDGRVESGRVRPCWDGSGWARSGLVGSARARSSPLPLMHRTIIHPIPTSISHPHR